MNIRILQLIEGAQQATGLTVIIDVFRAFSTACYVFGNGVERIIPVGNLELAYQLKRQHPEYLLIGERGGEPGDFAFERFGKGSLGRLCPLFDSVRQGRLELRDADAPVGLNRNHRDAQLPREPIKVLKDHT